MPKVSIVIPAHNEALNIPSLLESLDSLRQREHWDCEIVVVNDNSSDDTGSVASGLASKLGGVKIITRVSDAGMGNALKEGTSASSGDIVIWTMGDKSDNPETFPKMVAKIGEGYDMVFGSRYVKGGSRGDLSLHKALLSRGYSLVAGLLFGLAVSDITNAFRCFSRRVFDSVRLESGDFAISPEFAIKAHKAGFRLGEVPTGYTDRKEGRTTFKIVKMGPRYLSMFKFLFRRQNAR
ncbi:glycosyltransferase family 2 protein [Candidatus Woesearchaeota archaeon]|nr:glycosyltransferase family 2 protein [Candidatus Woesearchaeota archaeon]